MVSQLAAEHCRVGSEQTRHLSVADVQQVGERLARADWIDVSPL